VADAAGIPTAHKETIATKVTKSLNEKRLDSSLETARYHSEAQNNPVVSL